MKLKPEHFFSPSFKIISYYGGGERGNTGAP